MQTKNFLLNVELLKQKLFKNDVDYDIIIKDLKNLRELSLEKGNPTLTKALRLAYEHLEKNKGFFINIPDDEPIDSETDFVLPKISKKNNIESFVYFISLLTDLDKKNNYIDLKAYNTAFLNF